MPIDNPPLLFDGTPVRVTYGLDRRHARIIAAGVAGTVKYATDRQMDTDGLIARLVEMGGSYHVTIRVVASTPEAIELVVVPAPRG